METMQQHIQRFQEKLQPHLRTIRPCLKKLQKKLEPHLQATQPHIKKISKKLQPYWQKLPTTIKPHLTPKKLPVITAISVLFLAVIWLSGGSVTTVNDNQGGDNNQVQQQNNATAPTIQPQKVKSYHSSEADYAPILTVTGRTKANKHIQIKSEVTGTIESILFPIGSIVEAHTVIAKFKTEDKLAQLQQAEINAQHAAKDYEVIAELHAQNFQSELALLEAENRYKTALAILATQQKIYDNLHIKAPYKAVISEKHAEVGDYLTPGQAIFTVMEANPLLLEAAISERNFYDVKVGQEIQVTIGGNSGGNSKEKAATIITVSPTADEQTRTFTIEAAMENENYSYPIGATATAKIRLAPVKSHQIKASHLSLNDAGVIGIKIAENNTARFVPVSIIGDDNGILHVSGDIPRSTVIIGDGQGFISDGQVIITEPQIAEWKQ